ncbi:MAG: hypothetical protein RLZZ490_1935 [Cyanobacteriota bacterium]|jgi:hypothetical protein
MADPIMYQETMFTVLEDQVAEVFLTPEEMTAKLQTILENYALPLPPTLQKFPTLAEKAQHLRDNYCELEQVDGGYLQWYAVRLEK